MLEPFTRRTSRRILSGAVVFLGITAPAYALNLPAATVNALVERAAERGTLRVLVEIHLDDDGGTLALDAPVEAQAARDANIATAVAELELDNSLPSDRILYKYASIPYVSAYLTAAEIQRLADHPRVSGLGEVGHGRALLNESRPLIGGDHARNQGVDGWGWDIAILDTGADTRHLAFANALRYEACAAIEDVNNDGQQFVPGCTNGSEVATGGEGPNWASPTTILTRPSGTPTYTPDSHGTHVAGIALSHDSRYLGIAPAAGLMAFNVFGNLYPDENEADTRFDDVLSALQRIYDLRTQYRIGAVNLSLGFSDGYPDDCQLIYSGICHECGTAVVMRAFNDSFRNLLSVGIAPVVAAGNGGIVGPGIPACVSNAISVGATTDNDRIASYSDTSQKLSLLAPGGGQGGLITSAVVGGGFDDKNGTSMAAPHVAGAITALQQLCIGPRSAATVAEIVRTLKETGKGIFDPKTGVTIPRIDVGLAAEKLIAKYHAPFSAILEGGFGKLGVTQTSVGSIGSSGQFIGFVRNDPAGKIVAGGNTQSGHYGLGVVRYTSTGTPDGTFGGGSGVTGFEFGEDAFVTEGAVQADGKTVVVGWIAQERDWWFVARFTTLGELDPSFGDGSSRPGVTLLKLGTDGGRASAVALQADGRIVVGGVTHSGPDYITIARLDMTGRIDKSFGGNGLFVKSIGSTGCDLSGLSVAPDGKIVGVGFFAAGFDYFMILRLDSAGVLDTSFGGVNAIAGVTGSPIGTTGGRAAKLAIQPSGKIVVIGDTHSGPSYLTVARYNSNGTLDPTFGAGGAVALGRGDGTHGYGVAVQSDGKIVAVGDSVNQCGTREGIVARFLTSGELDPSFQRKGIGVVENSLFLNRVAISGGRTVVVGTGHHDTRADILVAELPRERLLGPVQDGKLEGRRIAIRR